jgi:hypothetical protein
MNVTTELLHIVEQAHSLARILEAAMRVIANRLRVDGCSVLLLDEHGGLVRRAAYHPTSTGRREPADTDAETIAGQVTAERRVATLRGETASLLAPEWRFRLAAWWNLVRGRYDQRKDTTRVLRFERSIGR